VKPEAVVDTLHEYAAKVVFPVDEGGAEALFIQFQGGGHARGAGANYHRVVLKLSHSNLNLMRPMAEIVLNMKRFS
jgi:hypothetical protein